MRLLLSFYIVLTLLFVSCSKDNDTSKSPEVEKVQLAEKKTSSGLTVTLWADDNALAVAYNKIYLTIKNASGGNVTDATVTYLPRMDMMTMSHSCPVEQPSYNADKGYYEGAAAFSMASGNMGSWVLTVNVNNEPLIFDITVEGTPANTKYIGTFQGTDGGYYTVSLIEPKKPKIGLNKLELLINHRQDLMTFPAVEDLTVEVTPQMPSMGHGSPNNINPVHTKAGHYTGKVNFTMTGDWRLHFQLKRGNIVIVEDAALDLLF